MAPLVPPCSPPAPAAADQSADVESCTWVARTSQGHPVRETQFELGINMPYMFATPVGECWHQRPMHACACTHRACCRGAGVAAGSGAASSAASPALLLLLLPRRSGSRSARRQRSAWRLSVAVSHAESGPHSHPCPAPLPAAHYLSAAQGTEVCAQRRDYTVLNPASDGYSTAYFVVVRWGGWGGC